MQLYKIADQYQNVLNEMVDQETGEINIQALKKLDEIKCEAKDKIIAVSSFIKNCEAEVNAIENALNLMQVREKRLTSRMEYLEEYLKSNMERCGISEISCPYFIIKIKKCPVSVDIKYEDLIPDRFKKTKMVTSIDRVGLKQHLNEGHHLPGISLKQNTRIEIK